MGNGCGLLSLPLSRCSQCLFKVLGVFKAENTSRKYPAKANAEYFVPTARVSLAGGVFFSHRYSPQISEYTQTKRCHRFESLKLILILVSAISFLGYGGACFLSANLKREFDRYRLGSQRTLVGGLQLCAGMGLLAGLSQPWMGRAASAGLTLMMLVAVGVRIKIEDSLTQTLPALFYMALNAYLCLAAY